MKLFSTALLLIFFTSFAFSQENFENHLKWYTFEEVSEMVKTEPRPLLVDVYTNWCGWCKKMDKDTYENPVIVEYLNDHFYPVKFNAETRDTVTFLNKEFINQRAGQRRGSHDLAIALLRGQMSYPTTVFLNGKLELLTAVPGYLDAKNMEPVLHFFAEEAYKNQTWEDFQAAFKSTLR